MQNVLEGNSTIRLDDHNLKPAVYKIHHGPTFQGLAGVKPSGKPLTCN